MFTLNFSPGNMVTLSLASLPFPPPPLPSLPSLTSPPLCAHQYMTFGSIMCAQGEEGQCYTPQLRFLQEHAWSIMNLIEGELGNKAIDSPKAYINFHSDTLYYAVAVCIQSCACLEWELSPATCVVSTVMLRDITMDARITAGAKYYV